MLQHKTKTVEFRNRSYTGTKDGKAVMKVFYGFDTAFARRNNQKAYFSITAFIKTARGRELAGGQLHDFIASYAPSLAPLNKWHLVNEDGVPMHYAANASYWLAIAIGAYPKPDSGYVDPMKAFMNTVVFGAVEDDGATFGQLMNDLEWARHDWQSGFVGKLVWKEVQTRVAVWCEQRAAALKVAFETDMRAFDLMD